MLWSRYFEIAFAAGAKRVGDKRQGTSAYRYRVAHGGNVDGTGVRVPIAETVVNGDLYIAGPPIRRIGRDGIDARARRIRAVEIYFRVTFGTVGSDGICATAGVRADIGKIKAPDGGEVGFVVGEGTGDRRGADVDRVAGGGVDAAAIGDDVDGIPAGIGRTDLGDGRGGIVGREAAGAIPVIDIDVIFVYSGDRQFQRIAGDDGRVGDDRGFQRAVAAILFFGTGPE